MSVFRSGVAVVLVAVTAVAGGACGDASTGGLPPTVVDSAGVEIVANRIPATGLPVYATLDSAPNLNLGFVLGNADSHLLRVEGAVTLADGSIAVANGNTQEVRFFDPAGVWVETMGGKGLDAGQYWDLTRMGRASGATLWAADHSRNRLTVFERATGVRGVYDVPADYSVKGRFGDGSYLLVPRWPISLHDQNPADTVRRDPAVYLRWWPERGDTASVGTFQHDQMLVVEREDGLSVGVPPFGRQTVQAVGPGRFYVGDQDSFTIDGFDPDGTRRQSVRMRGVDLALTPEQVDAVRRGTRGGGEYADRFWATVPDTRPAFGRLLLDGAGHLWVAENVATAAQPQTWMVFGPDGVVRGLVTVPAGFRVMEIGADYMLGVIRSTGGDERVQRYGLSRAG